MNDFQYRKNYIYGRRCGIVVITLSATATGGHLTGDGTLYIVNRIDRTRSHNFDK